MELKSHVGVGPGALQRRYVRGLEQLGYTVILTPSEVA
jgi:hypothetical protein